MQGKAGYDAVWQSSILVVAIAVAVLFLSFVMVAFRRRILRLEEQVHDLENNARLTDSDLCDVSDGGRAPAATMTNSTTHQSSVALRTGAASHTGFVRKANQDRIHAFLVGEYAVLIVADGCGGHPFGAEAAEYAADTAALSALRNLSSMGPDTELTDVARLALSDASQRLTTEGARRQLGSPGDGLRTTLLVVVANGVKIGFAYIGDGGGCIVSDNGRVNHFIKAQKDARRLNILEASLGPNQVGQAVTGSACRNVGELLILGTDGVFDRVEDCFFEDIFQLATQLEGDLTDTAQQIVNELISRRDNNGYVFDDNTSLALLGDSSFGHSGLSMGAPNSLPHFVPTDGEIHCDENHVHSPEKTHVSNE